MSPQSTSHALEFNAATFCQGVHTGNKWNLLGKGRTPDV
jgi:hypothetical protein